MGLHYIISQNSIDLNGLAFVIESNRNQYYITTNFLTKEKRPIIGALQALAHHCAIISLGLVKYLNKKCPTLEGEAA